MNTDILTALDNYYDKQEIVTKRMFTRPQVNYTFSS